MLSRRNISGLRSACLRSKSDFLNPSKSSHSVRSVAWSRNVSTTQTLAPDGRWLWNDEPQRRSRTIHVNLDAVAKIACERMSANRCVSIVKLAEGAYNKVYALTLDTGDELVARFPCTLVGDMHLATASEVATMDYYREVIERPAPKVIAWSSTPELKQKVGWDFILMERIKGEPLADHWNTINPEQAKYVLQDICLSQYDLLHPRFSQIGSLYFKDDVAFHLQDRPLYRTVSPDLPDEGKYRIGPITDRQFWFNGEVQVNDLCGPWNDMGSFLQDICRLAIRRVEAQYDKAHVRYSSASISLSRLEDYALIRRLLEECLALAPHIPLLLQNPQVAFPILSHPDLSRSNVLISTANYRVQAFIDWQGAAVLPVMQARAVPEAVHYEGSFIKLQGLGIEEDPCLPENLTADQVEQAKHELRLANRQHRLMRFLARHSPGVLSAWADPFVIPVQKFSDVVLRAWADGPVPLKSFVNELVSAWPDGIPCPVERTHAQFLEDANEFVEFERYRNMQTHVLALLGCGGDGWVSDAGYADAKRLLDKVRQDWCDKEGNRPFPFEDGMWSYYLT